MPFRCPARDRRLPQIRNELVGDRPQGRIVQLQEFKPENELEIAIVNAKQGVRPVADLMGLIARSNLFISSKGEVQSDWSGLDPLLFEKDGHPFVAVFSALSRPGLHSRMAEYVLQMNGREFFLRMPESYGVILNPGYVSQLIIPPTGVSEFRKDLKGGK